MLRYAARLESSVHHHILASKKLLRTAATLETKLEALSDTVHKSSWSLRMTIKRTKQYKQLVEHALSKQYNNRVVHLFGPISNL